MDWIHALRIVSGVMICVVALATLAIMRTYYEISKREKQLGNPHLLPSHVWTISASYLLLAIGLTLPFSLVRLVIVVVGLSLGIWALSLVWRATSLRYWAGPRDSGPGPYVTQQKRRPEDNLMFDPTKDE